MTEVTFRPPAGLDGPPYGQLPRRCPEITRTPRGYERCHRDEHEPGTRHHVRDRSWSTGGKTPRLQLGHLCDEGCRWADQVTPYMGSPPKASEAAAAGMAGARARLGPRSRKAR